MNRIECLGFGIFTEEKNVIRRYRDPVMLCGLTGSCSPSCVVSLCETADQSLT